MFLSTKLDYVEVYSKCLQFNVNAVMIFLSLRKLMIYELLCLESSTLLILRVPCFKVI